jgi:protein MpaA
MLMTERVARRAAGVLAAVAAVVVAGCVSHPTAALRPPPVVPPPPKAAVTPTPRAEAGPRTVLLGRSVQGRPIEASVFDGTRGCILILGSIHGDEMLAARLVERLAGYLKDHPEARANRTIVIIPRANPDGLAAGTRGNGRRVDVNRNFPTRNFERSKEHGLRPASEPETRALMGAIARYAPSCIVSVHCPLSCIDPDGGAASTSLAREIARHSPLPVKDLAALPGSLGSYAGDELHLQMVTYELDRRSLPSAQIAPYLERHLSALLTAIRECSSR